LANLDKQIKYPEAKVKYAEAMRRLNEDDFNGLASLALAERKERIEFLGTLLVEGKLKRGRSRALIADLWFCARNTVTQYIIQAQGIFQLEMGDPEEIGAMIRGRIEAIAEDALDKEKAIVVGDGKGLSHIEMVPDPDHKAAIQGYKEIVEMLGLKVKKHDHNHSHKYDEESVKKLQERANAVLEKAGHTVVLTEGEEVSEKTKQLQAPDPVNLPGGEQNGSGELRHAEPGIPGNHGGKGGGDGSSG